MSGTTSQYFDLTISSTTNPVNPVHGDLYYDSDSENWMIYDAAHSYDSHTYDSTVNHHNHIWINGTWDVTTGGDWYRIWPNKEEAKFELNTTKVAWIPVPCLCCDRLIKEEEDGLSLKLGSKLFWFHRRCFADKRNSKYIRSLIISEDLELI